MKKNPEKVLWFAVRGMLPKNRLRDKRMKRLKMFTTPSTKYDYFNPVTIMND
jgi:large subunit ribosomal protein L13